MRWEYAPTGGDVGFFIIPEIWIITEFGPWRDDPPPGGLLTMLAEYGTMSFSAGFGPSYELLQR